MNPARSGTMLLAAAVVCGCLSASARAAPHTRGQAMTLQITSTAFTPGGEMPAAYTCEGRDRSPPLAWSGAPPGTKSFVLIVDDPDAPDPKAPKMTWVHWVLYDLPASATGLPEAVQGPPNGARAAVTDFKRPGYGGPCPPIGRHRYFFKLYAVDALLGDLGPQARKADVERAMAGHVLAQAELVGTYQKKK